MCLFKVQAIGFLALLCGFSLEFQLEIVPSPKSTCGEGPHWDVESQSLYYNDINGHEATVLRYDYNENKTYTATIDGEPLISFIIPVANTTNQFAVGMGRRVGVIQWDGKSPKATLLRVPFEVESGSEFDTNRFNDAKADPFGRLFAGTQRLAGCGGSNNLANASFYMLEKGSGVTQLRKNVFISNGLAWNEKINKFYYIDSCEFIVKEFDYDPSTGALSNERVVVDFSLNGAFPGFVLDGMTIDTAGNLYIATYSGFTVYKVSPTTGQILLEIKLPAKQVTSAAFGGPNLDILFVTTAATDRDGPQPPLAGFLYQITGLDAHGLPGNKVRI